jgi:dCTP deaminase
MKEDRWIEEQAQLGMIEPFVNQQIKEEKGQKIISYGLSSYGYDIRVANHFKVFTNVYNSVVDPKHFTEDAFVDIIANECIIPPNSFALARSIEYFRIPRNVLTLCVGKSTYARCGIIVNVTPFEPEWEGHVTLEISNTTPLPAKIYANEGIAQVIFLNSENVCRVSYADRKGKYQGQTGITVPRV